MKPSNLALRLSMFCLAVSACGVTRSVAPLRPDLTNPERFDCTEVQPADRPSIPPEDVIDLDRVMAASSVPAAVAIVQEEVTAYVRSVRAREGVAARYIVRLEGVIFECANDDEWLRDFYAELPEPDSP